MDHVVFHIPVCPFSQRLEILLALKGRPDAVRFEVVDITKPRADWLTAKTGGKPVPLPIMETPGKQVLRESLVLMGYLEQVFPERPVLQGDPVRRAVEAMLVSKEGPFTNAGYTLVMNQDRGKREALTNDLLAKYAAIDEFLVAHNPQGTFLFEDFGWAEAVFTPMFMRFWFLEYYEDFALPPAYERVRRWVDACIAHPAAQQVTRERIVKLYYDYAKGFGNGALPPGRMRSSFVFEPDWPGRPMPPKDKYGHSATDAELGLVG